jgi:hypothetical protein
MTPPTALTISQLKSPFDDVTAGQLDITFEAADNVNGNTFVCTGREILIMKNTTGTNTVTITSVANDKGRTEDLTAYSLATLDIALWTGGLTNTKGWQSTSKTIALLASAAEVTFAVVRLPAGYP